MSKGVGGLYQAVPAVILIPGRVPLCIGLTDLVIIPIIGIGQCISKGIRTRKDIVHWVIGKYGGCSHGVGNGQDFSGRAELITGFPSIRCSGHGLPALCIIGMAGGTSFAVGRGQQPVHFIIGIGSGVPFPVGHSRRHGFHAVIRIPGGPSIGIGNRCQPV